MPVSFSRTLRSLEADRTAPGGLGLVLVITFVWVTWMVRAEIPVYETTRQARIEVSRSPFPVARVVDGRVESTNLTLGAEVTAGQTLVQLDSSAWELARSESLAKIEALHQRRAAVDQEVLAERATERAMQE